MDILKEINILRYDVTRPSHFNRILVAYCLNLIRKQVSDLNWLTMVFKSFEIHPLYQFIMVNVYIVEYSRCILIGSIYSINLYYPRWKVFRKHFNDCNFLDEIYILFCMNLIRCQVNNATHILVIDAKVTGTNVATKVISYFYEVRCHINSKLYQRKDV